MKKKLVGVLLTGALTCSLALAGCSKETPASAENTVQTEALNTGSTEPAAEDDAVSDQAAADEVAALIDAIYVQERTDSTDEQCAQAKPHGML